MPPQASQSQPGNIPPPPPGYTLDSQSAQIPPPPPGYTLDQAPTGQQQPQQPTTTWQEFKKTMPGWSDLVHAVGLPANRQEAQQMGQAEANKSAGQKIKDALSAGLGPGPGVIASMAKEGYRGIKGTFSSDPTEQAMAGTHLASSVNPFAAPVVDAMTQQGLGTPQANAIGIANAVPMAAGSAPVKGLLGRMLLFGKSPEGAYESALKPSTVMPPAQRARIVQTGLQEGIPVSKGGLQNIGDAIDQVNAEIANKIAANPTRPIDPRTAVQNLAGVRQRFTNQVNPRADLAAIDAAGQEFSENQGIPPTGAAGPVPAMNAADAQAMKQGTYRALGDKAYGEVGSASKEAQKALARGLKEELANQFPELNELNARDGRLIDLQDSLERAVGRISNHQIMGIGTPIVGSAAKAVTGSSKIAGVASVIKAVLDNPNVKSRLAIAVSQGKTPAMVQIPRIAAYGAALSRASQPQSLPFLPGSSGPSAQSPNQ